MKEPRRMTEEEIERLVRDAAGEYRLPANPPLERMWQQIETRVFPSSVTRLETGSPRRGGFGRLLALAATLVLGVTLGYGGARWTGPAASAPAAEVAAAPVPAVAPSPFVGVASDYLEQTTALMVTVAGHDAVTTLTPATVTRARELLSTTRLLLDAGVESPGLRELLQDIELVLAQLVRLPERPRAADARYVTEAVAEREVLPRLTLFLADSRGLP